MAKGTPTMAKGTPTMKKANTPMKAKRSPTRKPRKQPVKKQTKQVQKKATRNVSATTPLKKEPLRDIDDLTPVVDDSPKAIRLRTEHDVAMRALISKFEHIPEARLQAITNKKGETPLSCVIAEVARLAGQSHYIKNEILDGS